MHTYHVYTHIPNAMVAFPRQAESMETLPREYDIYQSVRQCADVLAEFFCMHTS